MEAHIHITSWHWQQILIVFTYGNPFGSITATAAIKHHSFTSMVKWQLPKVNQPQVNKQSP